MPITRRQAIKTLAATTIAATTLGRIPAFAQTPAAAPANSTPSRGPFTLPELPYAYDALEPYIDAETMHLHHDKHHAAYVAKLNEAMAKEPFVGISASKTPDVDNLLRILPGLPESIRTAVRNNGGGHANHSLFWETLTPHAGTPMVSDELTKALNDDLGGMDKFKEAATKAGMGLFGSGWVWLVLNLDKKLTLLTLPNQDSPLTEGNYPLFGIDVWEHAYYLKYRNVRADYLKAIWNVVNWKYISDRYAGATKS
jgi:Fe-Mn family superoxide dismutase